MKAILLLCLSLAPSAAAAGPVQASGGERAAESPSVGLPGHLGDLILPGGELEVAAGDSLTPLVIDWILGP